MKTAKKLLALLLTMVMLFALCACSGDDQKDAKLSEDDLNGEWTLTFVPSAMGLDKKFPFEGFTPAGTITTKAVIEDGTMKLYNDGIAARTFWEKKKETLHFWMPHTALQEIDFQLNEAVGFLSLNDHEGALPKLEVLISLTYSLPQSCNFDIKNIF